MRPRPVHVPPSRFLLRDYPQEVGHLFIERWRISIPERYSKIVATEKGREALDARIQHAAKRNDHTR
jgi:hypothetical protein